MIDDNDYVIRIIRHLDRTFSISFFITTKDFDVLYNWWEKQIPMNIIKEAIETVTKRWRKKNKEIYSFANYNYEVKKRLSVFQQMHVSSEKGRESGGDELETNPLDDIEIFLATLPEPLQFLRTELLELLNCIKKKEPVSVDTLNTKLLVTFKDDDELNMKVKIFLECLAPPLRKPAIENRYRVNFLIDRYRIPDFVAIADELS
ncbi:MAG: hypothetical protein GY765_23805 [bacterium]|nr:hypothetical protein [bacterium]